MITAGLSYSVVPSHHPMFVLAFLPIHRVEFRAMPFRLVNKWLGIKILRKLSGSIQHNELNIRSTRTDWTDKSSVLPGRHEACIVSRFFTRSARSYDISTILRRSIEGQSITAGLEYATCAPQIRFEVHGPWLPAPSTNER